MPGKKRKVIDTATPRGSGRKNKAATTITSTKIVTLRTNAPPPPSTKHGIQAFRLPDLPAELRLRIYTYALVVGKIFYTPTYFELKEHVRFPSPSSLSTYSTPNVSLLRVSRQVHAEAEPVYLSKNLFVLPHGYILHAPFRTIFTEGQKQMRGDMSRDKDFPCRWLFSRKGFELVKNVSIALCERGAEAGIHWGMTRSAWDSAHRGASFSHMTQPDRLRLAHKHANERLAMQWSFQLKVLGLFNLNYLEIDLNNSFCAFGCCRMVYAEMDVFEAARPKELRVLGSLGRKEESWIMETWAKRIKIEVQELVERYGVRFGGEDAWAMEEEKPKAKSETQAITSSGAPDLMVG